MEKNIVFITVFYVAACLLGAFMGYPQQSSLYAKQETVKNYANTVSASDFQIEIMGSIVSRVKENNVVLLKFTETRKVNAFRSGHKIFKKYVITEIDENYIIVSHNGKLTKILKDGFTGFEKKKKEPSSLATQNYFSEDGFERNGNEIQLSEDYRNNLLKNELPKILMQASAEPIIENEQVIGFMFDQIAENSIYQKMGLKNGDIVTEINETPLDDITASIKLLHRLKYKNSFKVKYLRNGKDVSVNVNVK